MTRKEISEAVGNISPRHIREASDYTAKPKRPLVHSMIAAVLALCLIAGSVVALLYSGTMTVTAYACGTDQKIPEAGAVITTGTLDDSGEMTGHPLMFYLSGKDISTVRFSCKNQQINFVDWTERRDEYGLAQNFTVSYGPDESQYYYLLIDWVPTETIRELTESAGSTIAALPEALRGDVIVMEITFENGTTAAKAITVTLQEDGTFFAAFTDYSISDADAFVRRTDAEPIPREILYAQGDSPAWQEEYPFGDAPVIEDDYQKADPDAPETIVNQGAITFTGTIIAHWAESTDHVILVEADENTQLPYDKVVFKLPEEWADWGTKDGTRVRITCSDWFLESLPPIGDLISIEELSGPVETALDAANAYYEGTVFEVVSMEVKTQSDNEIVFSVCVSREGVLQEPNRTIWLEWINGAWEVVNEGY